MLKYYFIYISIIISFLNSCNFKKKDNQEVNSTIKEKIKKDSTTYISIVDSSPKPSPCIWDTYFKSEGLVNIQKVDSTLQVELKYSTEDNFMQRDMYGCLDSCYLQKDVAYKLKNAQKHLKSIDSNLSLLVYDGVRPRAIQQYMWDILDMPINEKVKFVSNPKRGSLHNFGAAVDITLYNLTTQKALDMGTPYDYIGVEAWPTKERLMLENGVLNEQQINNRKLLRKVMIKAKFFNIQTEWWHFNSCYRKKAYELYSIIEGIDSTLIKKATLNK